MGAGKVKKIFIISCCLALFSFYFQEALVGQNIENLFGKKSDTTRQLKKFFNYDPFQLNGNYGLMIRSYSTNGATNRQTPLTSTLYANATTNIYNITIPFNFVLNNLDDFNHPFQKGYFEGIFTNQRNRLARIGASPYYKWVKIHAGHRYMNFSDFTLSNHNFLGGGIELTPGKFRFAAMAGRLAKAEPIDLSLSTPNLPVYKRTGWGFKIGYGSVSDFVDLILFNAKDDPNSLDFVNNPENVNLPGENLVLGLKGQKSIIKNLKLDFEISRSGHTRNINDQKVNNAKSLSLNYNNFLFDRKTSTSYANAASASLNYRLKKIQIGAEYKRIEPEYKTFGAYFFNDDLENSTLNISGFGLKNFSFTASGGLQRNNLDKSRSSTYKRLIMMLNASYQLDSWVFGANFSNFQSEVNYVLNDNLDSLNVVIATFDLSANISKSITGSQGNTHNFNLIGGMQKVNQNIETPTGNPATDMYYANLGYVLSLKSKWMLQTNFDFNQNSISGIRQDRYGVSGRIGKNMFKNKLDMSLGAQYYKGSSPADQRSSHQTNSNFRLNWKLSKLHALQLQLSSIQNKRIINSNVNQFNEFVASIGFNGRFDYRPFQKNDSKSNHE